MADLSPEIEKAAKSPKRANVDGHDVTARSVKEIEEADQYLSRKNAANKSKLPIRTARLKPDGTT